MDHTLIHTKEVPLDQLKFRHSRDRHYKVLIDELLSIYEVKMGTVGFHIKMRPFLGDFLMKLHNERKFEVFYYTAGT